MSSRQRMLEAQFNNTREDDSGTVQADWISASFEMSIVEWRWDVMVLTMAGTDLCREWK